MNNLPVKIEAPTDVWGALIAAAPDLAEQPDSPTQFWATHPGFRNWLIHEFALEFPSSLIRDKLRSIISDQLDEGVSPWPALNSHDIDTHRRGLRSEWYPIAEQLRDRIANVGVLDKNQRLMKLLGLATELEEKIWEERNEKTGELYLISELRALYKQIAEEKGEIGELGDSAVGALGDIGRMLASAVAIQGSGMTPANEPPIEVYFKDIDEAS